MRRTKKETGRGPEQLGNVSARKPKIHRADTTAGLSVFDQLTEALGKLSPEIRVHPCLSVVKPATPPHSAMLGTASRGAIRRFSISGRLRALIWSRVRACEMWNLSLAVRRRAARCAPQPSLRPKSWARVRT